MGIHFGSVIRNQCSEFLDHLPELAVERCAVTHIAGHENGGDDHVDEGEEDCGSECACEDHLISMGMNSVSRVYRVYGWEAPSQMADHRPHGLKNTA